ncbi:sensor histidine kinase [Actinoplanes sp. NPDC051513]|uniref:sensor histidine kinase n=1 Tax=Actinoplanes sp. NPDC051513 TaxID=3363908 RepID=UPI0037B61D15
MDRERSVTVGEAHVRYSQWWDVYFGVVAVAVATAILINDSHALWRRLLATGVIAVMMILHAVVGRRFVRRDAEAVSLAIVQILLFAVAAAAIPFATWLLFAMIPMIFQLTDIKKAIPLVVVVNLVTPAIDLVISPESLPGDLMIALISAAAGIWLGFWIIRVIEQNVERGQLIAELEASRAEVARLSHEAGVAAERARLAGEIHDTLAQGFTSIITLLQAADPALRDERLALAVRTAKENLAESRALVAALTPAALTEGSLPDAVRRQAARFAEETGTPATVRVTGDERALPTKVEVVLLRAAQEALTNVRRHAGAREAAVLLAYAPASVRLVVRDDGRGFDPAAADGFGLNGMRARADQVSGVLTVRSDPDTGTTIELEVPA